MSKTNDMESALEAAKAREMELQKQVLEAQKKSTQLEGVVKQLQQDCQQLALALRVQAKVLGS